MGAKAKFRRLLLATALSASTVVGIAGLSDSNVSAASGCGIANTTQAYGFSLFGNWYQTISHYGSTYACKDSTKITYISKNGHSCNKVGWYTIANSITKSSSVGSAGGPAAVALYECNFHGGAQIKGVGIGVTRDLFIRHEMYVRYSTDTVPWVRKSEWTTCC